MRHRIKKIIAKSKIVRFFRDLNKNLLLDLYKSKTYGFFSRSAAFLKNAILENINDSIIITKIKKGYRSIGMYDIGLFIVLVTMLNTLVMIILKRGIDIFSIYARIFFFILGVFLMVGVKK